MAKRIGPTDKYSRRFGVQLYLKGIRCSGDKASRRLDIPPGMHGAKRRRRKISDYARQLHEKQKLKLIYGMLERQFRLFFDRAQRKKGITGDNLVQSLEGRLDNVVYRLLFMTSRPEARQFVNHGHIRVNGRKVNIPSYGVKQGDVIEISQKEKSRKRVEANLEMFKDRNTPEWLELDRKGLKGQIVRLPHPEEAALPVEIQQIVELYSK